MKTDKSYHHGDLRNALILKGLEVLNEKGMADLSLRGIARELVLATMRLTAISRIRRSYLKLLPALVFVSLRHITYAWS